MRGASPCISKKNSRMRNPQLNEKGDLQHLLNVEGLPREHLVRILDTAASFVLEIMW